MADDSLSASRRGRDRDREIEKRREEEEEEEEEEQKDLLNKLLNKPSIIVSFSIRPTNREAVKALRAFNEIAKREAGSRGRSGVFVKAMIEYNQKHGLGNPQLLITTYMDPQAPSPMRVVCNFLGGATSEGKVYCRKRGSMWIQALSCYSCSNNQLKKKGLK